MKKILLSISVLFFAWPVLASPIHDAAKNGDMGGVTKAMTHGFKIDDTDSYGWTALHYAAYNNNTEMIRFLAGKGAGVNFRNSSGESALIVAAANGKTEAIGALVDLGADIGARDNSGNTALIRAVTGWNISYNTVSTLLSYGASPNTTAQNGWYPIMYAINAKNPGIVNLLISKGASVNVSAGVGKSQTTPLKIAKDMKCKGKDKSCDEIVKALKKAGAKK